jgi:N-glycosylase/DNA lyase
VNRSFVIVFTNMIKILAPDFDLAKTLNSGQVFHWQKVGDAFAGTIGDLPLHLEQQEDVLKVRCGATPQPARGTRALPRIVAHYFALDHPLAEICGSFPKDPVMSAAREFCRGLRIIRQPKWECLATFICSSMKQVAHIRQISLALRKRFGDRRAVMDYVVYTFPTARRLAEASEKELLGCKLGYRAKNLRATALLVSSGEADLEGWSTLSDPELRKQLCALPGVGPKIANCVMLFAYERLRAFPIDVWIGRVLVQNYFSRRKKMTPRRLREFSETYFGEHGGYAQQYLFHYARVSSRKPGDAKHERKKSVIARTRSPARGRPQHNDAQVVSGGGLR